MGYCPQIVEPVLALIVERAIGIDVEIQAELEELEELISSTNDSTSAIQSGLLSNLDPFDAVDDGQSSSDSDSDSEEGDVENFSDVSSEAEGGDGEDVDRLLNGKMDEKEANRRAKRLRGMVAKLDSMMGLVLKWLRNSSRPNEANQHPHFVTMMGIFDRTILTTFKSRYTQFLIFYLVSLPSFPDTTTTNQEEPTQLESVPPAEQPNSHADVFLGLLLHNTLIPQEPPIPMLTRIASASYLASFISRALCVGKEECRNTATVCCQWITEHLAGLESLVTGEHDDVVESGQDILQGGGYTELGVFYAVSQAMFLIFCFRWRDLLESGEDDETDEENEATQRRRWIRPLDIMQRLIVSPLNPLKVCFFPLSNFSTDQECLVTNEFDRSALLMSSINSLGCLKKWASSIANPSSNPIDVLRGRLYLPPRHLLLLELPHLLFMQVQVSSIHGIPSKVRQS